MPYTSYTKAAAAVLEKKYKDAAAALKANKNPLKSGDLKKALEKAGKELQAKLEADIAGVRKSAIQHFQQLDQWLGECNRELAAGKAAAAKGDTAAATEAANKIDAAQKLAAADAQEFGGSWFEYRGYNLSDVDAKYKAKYNDETGKIMAESKNYLVKIAKMDSIHKEALAVKNLAVSKGKGDMHSLIEKQGSAEELSTTLKGMYHTNFGERKDPSVVMGNMDSIKRYAADPKTSKTVPLKNIEQLFANFTNLLKTYVQGVAAMQKVYDTTSKQFSDEDKKDAEIKKHLGESQKLITETRYKVQVLETGYKTTLKDMEKLRGYYKK